MISLATSAWGRRASRVGLALLTAALLVLTFYVCISPSVAIEVEVTPGSATAGGLPFNKDHLGHSGDALTWKVMCHREGAKRPKRSDLKGHSERSEESRRLLRLRLATTRCVGLPHSFQSLAMTM